MCNNTCWPLATPREMLQQPLALFACLAGRAAAVSTSQRDPALQLSWLRRWTIGPKTTVSLFRNVRPTPTWFLTRPRTSPFTLSSPSVYVWHDCSLSYVYSFIAFIILMSAIYLVNKDYYLLWPRCRHVQMWAYRACSLFCQLLLSIWTYKVADNTSKMNARDCWQAYETRQIPFSQI